MRRPTSESGHRAWSVGEIAQRRSTLECGTRAATNCGAGNLARSRLSSRLRPGPATPTSRLESPLQPRLAAPPCGEAALCHQYGGVRDSRVLAAPVTPPWSGPPAQGRVSLGL